MVTSGNCRRSLPDQERRCCHLSSLVIVGHPGTAHRRPGCDALVGPPRVRQYEDCQPADLQSAHDRPESKS